jgi:hypothetical protein
MSTDLLHKTVETTSLDEPPFLDMLGRAIRAWVEMWSRGSTEAKLVESWLLSHSVVCDRCSTMGAPPHDVLVGVCEEATRVVERRANKHHGSSFESFLREMEGRR